MPLTVDQLDTFTNDGAVAVRGAVPFELLQPAMSLIDDWFLNHMDSAQITTYAQRTFAPELGSHPDLLALFHQSPAAELATQLIGDYQPIETAQIQIRVPEATFPDAQPEKAMHVDGVACPHLDPDELRTFNLLVGVVLSDITDPAGGALRYVPGGHLQMAEWFRTEWSLGMTDQVPPSIDAKTGTPFLGKPGDVLLMHHLVPHAVGRNHTSSPRIMAYFRVSHVDHVTRRLDALREPWLDYQGLRSTAAGQSA